MRATYDAFCPAVGRVLARLSRGKDENTLLKTVDWEARSNKRDRVREIGWQGINFRLLSMASLYDHAITDLAGR